MARVELQQLAKLYPGRVEALQPIDLSIPAGELLVILGPSGLGQDDAPAFDRGARNTE